MYKELSDKDLEGPLEELKLSFLESDVSYEISEMIAEKVKEKLKKTRVKRGEDISQEIKKVTRDSIMELIGNKRWNLIESIFSSTKVKKPYIVIFFGINGSGKTTTIAKVAYQLKQRGVNCVIAACDTFRAAAQEQLAYHASKVDVPIIRGKYGSDPASVAYDAINYANSRKIDTVLIDTAGRIHIDSDLIDELRRIVRISKPDKKVLVLDSLAGSDVITQAKSFDDAVGIDSVILTKVDADVKGGSILSVLIKIKKPVEMIGIGQSYNDLIEFNTEWLINKLLGD